MISQKSNFVTQWVKWDYLKENVRRKVEVHRKYLKGVECNRIAVAWSWMGATRERNGSGRRIQEGRRPSSQWLPNTIDHSVKPIWAKRCLIIIKDTCQIDMKLQYHIMVHCIICFISRDRQIILPWELFQTILQLEKSTNQSNKQANENKM